MMNKKGKHKISKYTGIIQRLECLKKLLSAWALERHDVCGRRQAEEVDLNQTWSSDMRDEGQG